ncbi:hypothetical protein HDV05_001113 [Chytridiales sp. JEL 0842]|nr:hypothetical protein HDV05_001113 [Chytridiales sp. JEL 0842]
MTRCVASAVISEEQPDKSPYKLSTTQRKLVWVDLVRAAIYRPGAMALYSVDSVKAPRLPLSSSPNRILWDVDKIREEDANAIRWLESIQDSLKEFATSTFECCEDDNPFFTPNQQQETNQQRPDGGGLDDCEQGATLDTNDRSGDDEFGSEQRRKTGYMCFLMSSTPCNDDMDFLINLLKSRGLDENAIDHKKHYDWIFSSSTAVEWFHARIFCLTDSTASEVESLRVHIKKNCLSDVPNVAMYFTDGETADGIPKYRCIRGTNIIEGYHRHLRKIFHHHAGSPKLLHHLLLEFNYRWNLKMALKYRSLPLDIGGFYDQHLIEKVNNLVDGLLDNKPYMAWEGALDFQDTTEVFGMPPNHSTEPSSPSATHITKSARDLAALLSQEPCAPIKTEAEKQKFASEVIAYAGNQTGKVDFNTWACRWNDSVLDGSCGNGIYRKTAGHMREYYKAYTEKAHINNTMAAAREESNRLADELRRPSSIPIPVGTVPAPAAAVVSTGVTRINPTSTATTSGQPRVPLPRQQNTVTANLTPSTLPTSVVSSSSLKSRTSAPSPTTTFVQAGDSPVPIIPSSVSSLDLSSSTLHSVPTQTVPARFPTTQLPRLGKKPTSSTSSLPLAVTMSSNSLPPSSFTITTHRCQCYRRAFYERNYRRYQGT